eukprot:5350707-Amphidinium_carterae.1
MTDEGQSSPSERVCSFVARNEEMLRTWVPDCLINPLPLDEVSINDTIFQPAQLRCEPVSCARNQVLLYAEQFRSFYCAECGVGEVPDAQQKSCLRCPAGEEVSGNLGRCRQCAPGSSKAVESTSCESCPRGKYMAIAGQSECLFCNTTHYQDEIGAVDCKPCSATLAGGVTPVLGSTSASYCICPQGTFRPLDGNTCASCPSSMICKEGADEKNLPADSSVSSSGPYPAVAEGYMSIPGSPFTIYK